LATKRGGGFLAADNKAMRRLSAKTVLVKDPFPDKRGNSIID
jgi:hypothetical protein